MTPRYETIVVDQVISRAKVQLCLLDSSNDLFLEMAIFEALDHLDCASELSKECCEIDVCDGIAKLPKGLVRFLAMKIPHHTEDHKHNEEPTATPRGGFGHNQFLIYADTDFLNKCGCNGRYNNFFKTFQINKGYIHLGDNHSHLDKIMVAYLGLNVDEFGRTLIYKRYERALMAYACQMFMLAFKSEYTNYEVEMYRKTWVEQKNYLKGQDRMAEFELDKLEISALMLTRLITPRIYLNR